MEETKIPDPIPQPALDRYEILRRVADTITDKPFQIKIQIKPQGWLHERLQKWGLKPVAVEYEVHPMTMGNMVRISKELLAIEKAEKSSDHLNFLEQGHMLVAKYTENVARIVAIGLTNTEKEPSEKVVRSILWNFNAKELKLVFHIIVVQMNLSDFISSITSIKGANILDEKPVSAMPVNGKEVSPSNQGS